ncbi:hypothetical protein TCON_2527 [Astathelohania contejeani]|uniref:Uncharacterized protein n=1 Tax=Astathelohania contejeani TaxID=164912 RepID=A0ABQ7HVU4_9MICR|nr:hypothetical protein TCON_2527 [Thelohania contejeani]
MLKIKKIKPFGKTYQFRDRKGILNINKLWKGNGPYLHIQTYGIKQDGSVTCTSQEELETLLKCSIVYGRHKSIIINSISTIPISNKTNILFKTLNIIGIDVYLISFGWRKFAHVDSVYY